MEPEPHNSIDPVEELHSAHADVTSAQRRLLDAIVACDREHLWERDGARDFTQWVSAELGISNWAARRWITAAHVLPELPRISAAFESGELGLDKTLDLCRFATADDEAKLIRWAQKVTPSTVRQKADMEVAKPREEAAETDGRRYLSYWWTDDRTVLSLQGSLPADAGAVVAQALDRLAGRLPDISDDVEGGTAEPETFLDSLEVRRADALVALCSAAIANDQDSDRATLVVHCELDALLQESKGAIVENGPVISSATLDRLICDSRLQTVLHDTNGKIVGIGTTSYIAPRWLKRQLRYRDGGCTFPGCEARWFLQAHHIVPWPQGPTEPDNLVLVCMFHHKLVHEYGWKVELGSDDTASWYRPTGEVLEPGRSPPKPMVA